MLTFVALINDPPWPTAMNIHVVASLIETGK
jgi:hypothetical protein